MSEEAFDNTTLVLYSEYNYLSTASIFCEHSIMRDIENSSICYYDIGIVLDHCNAIKPTWYPQYAITKAHKKSISSSKGSRENITIMLAK